MTNCIYTADGIICAAFFKSFFNRFTVATYPFLLTSTLFVMYLSFFVVHRKDIINLYTINVYIPMIILAIAQLIFHIQHYLSYYGIKSELAMYITLRIVLFWDAFNIINFRALSIVLLISIYCLYRFPLAHKCYFSLKHWVRYFAVFHIISIVYAITFTLVEQFDGRTGTITLAIMLPIFISAFFITASLSILALINILNNIRNKSHLRSTHASREQRQLITTIIYISSPNLTNLPGLIMSVLYLKQIFCKDTAHLESITNYFSTAQTIGVQVRPLIVTISTLIALPTYRNAVIDLFKRFRSKNKVKVSVMLR